MHQRCRILVSVALALTALAAGRAQPAPASAPQTGAASQGAPKEEVLELNPFVVSTQKTGRFTSSEATSSGRVAVNIFTSPQSITVITREAFDDVGALRILDVAKYSAGVTESTIPNGLDRTTIRGFQTEGNTIDGFRTMSQLNVDPAFVDRLEIVKGPNAILSPSGVPGGTINLVTRKPTLSNHGSVVAGWGLYDGLRAEVDVNRAFSLSGGNKLGVRAVGLLADNNDGWRGTTGHSAGVMPMAMLQTSRGAQLTVQGLAFTARVQNDLGLPIDPSSGTHNDAKLLSGVSEELNTSDEDYRFERRQEVRGFFTTPITENLSMRLAARYAHLHIAFVQALPSISLGAASASGVVSGTSGGGYDPRTRVYVPGKVFFQDPTTGAVTEYAAAPFPRSLVRGGQFAPLTGDLVDFQNDFAHKLDLKAVKFTTVGGFAYSYAKSTGDNYVVSKANIDYDRPAPAPYVIGARNVHSTITLTTQQIFVTSSASFFDGKLVLNGGLSHNNIDLVRVDPLLNPSRSSTNDDTSLKSYGAVVNAHNAVALFYSYNENTATPLNNQLGSGALPPPQKGSQHEYGIRFQGWDKRLYATLSYFDIKQSNFSVPNPGNLQVPAPNPRLPNLLSDRAAKGWEFEVRANLTPELSLIGNWTDFTNRDANNIPFRGTAEKSAALLANYTFKRDSGLAGFSLGAGIEYRGRVPGDQQGDLRQPSFWLGERTLVNVMGSYSVNNRLKVQGMIANLFDEKYLASSINRAAVYPGAGINPQLRINYSF